jgi:hypothetical protein
MPFPGSDGHDARAHAPRATSAAAISIDPKAGKAGGTATQGIFLKSTTTGARSGKIISYVDSTGVTIFTLLPGRIVAASLTRRRLPAPIPG